MDKTAKIDAVSRLAALFDDGVFTQIDSYAKGAKGDTEVVAGFGCINDVQCYAFAQNSDVNGGAITVAQCTKIKKVYSLAKKTGCPVIGIYDSNGVMLTEGFEVLNAYGEIVKAATEISGVIPQISIINGACLGTSTLMANMSDVVVAVNNSDFYVTAPSDVTVEQTANQGAVDIVADNFDTAVNEVKKLVALLPQNNLQGVGFSAECNQPSVVANDSSSLQDIISSITDDDISVELKKDYGENVITALSCIQGCTTGIVAFKGEALCPACCYKAEGFIKLCDAFNIPIITIANADGLKKDNEAQMLVALTKLTSAYATATPFKFVILLQAGKVCIPCPSIFLDCTGFSINLCVESRNSTIQLIHRIDSQLHRGRSVFHHIMKTSQLLLLFHCLTLTFLLHFVQYTLTG